MTDEVMNEKADVDFFNSMLTLTSRIMDFNLTHNQFYLTLQTISNHKSQ